MKEPSTDFGKYLRNVRKQRKLTIRQLEDKSGISNAYISHVESGKRNVPMPEVIRKLSTSLDIPYEEMMREAGHLDQDNITTYVDCVNLCRLLQEQNARLYKALERIAATEWNPEIDMVYAQIPCEMRMIAQNVIGREEEA